MAMLNIKKLTIILSAAVLAAAVFAAPVFTPVASAETLSQPERTEGGLYRHSWFMDSFLDLKEDFEAAKKNGKRLVLMIEQRGCIYCKKIQTEILVDKEIQTYVRKHFDVVQIDMWGAKEVVDFDGKEMTEKELVRRWGTLFTPTIVFMPDDWKKIEGKSGKDAAVAMMPGAFGKGTFLALFEWVAEKHYEKGEHFQKYVNDRYWAKRGGRPDSNTQFNRDKPNN